MNIIVNYLSKIGFAKNSFFVSSIIWTFLIIIIAFLGNLLAKKMLSYVSKKFRTGNNSFVSKLFLREKVLKRFSHLVPALTIYMFTDSYPVYQLWVEKISYAYFVFVAIYICFAALDILHEIYKTYEISNIKPIRGYIQLAKIVIFIVGFIITISNMLDESPYYILSGIGALMAIFLLIFKDSLLGLVAAIQLSTNDMVRLGDWIEMPKYGVDGNVIDISLNSVKVKNFDLTVVTIPTYTLISDSFKNWRSMHSSGGRRIKRAIYIDTSSIQFCTNDMIEQFKKIHYLKDYIVSKLKEIDDYNSANSVDPVQLVNGRRLTNIGTFRAYVENYLKNHPKLHKDYIQLVRQLPSGEFGLPIEIYVYTTDTELGMHESIQADIFDHIFSVVSQFGLRVFQQPSGHDMRIGFNITHT